MESSGSARVHPVNRMMAAVAVRVQDAETDQIDHQASRCDDQKQAGADRLRFPDPVDRLDDDPGCNPEQRRPVDQRRQDFPSLVAVGLALIGRPERDPGAEEGQAERPGVGEHVAGVGQEGERPAHDPSRHFDQHEPDGESQHRRQRTKGGCGDAGRE
jgi:hypothetical protein